VDVQSSRTIQWNIRGREQTPYQKFCSQFLNQNLSMKVSMKEGKLTLTTDVTITEVMMDILQADCPCDITVDDENHLVISKVLENCEDIEEEIQHLKNIMKDLEGAMLSKEVEEEAKKVDVDTENIENLSKEMKKLREDVLAGKYGSVKIAMFAVGPTKIAYCGNVPAEIGAILAFEIAKS